MGEQTLRDAFADQSGEGRMDVNRHPLEDSYSASANRYFNAKALTLDPAGDFVDTDSPHQGVASLWTLALSNADGRYFEELTLAAFKAAIVELGPALYWALDSIDGVNDLSPNNRDGTAQGGVTIGGYSAGLLAGFAGDSGTDFDGSNDSVVSSYNPFDGTRTFCGWARQDEHAADQLLMGSTAALDCPTLMIAGGGWTC